MIEALTILLIAVIAAYEIDRRLANRVHAGKLDEMQSVVAENANLSDVNRQLRQCCGNLGADLSELTTSYCQQRDELSKYRRRRGAGGRFIG